MTVTSARRLRYASWIGARNRVGVGLKPDTQRAIAVGRNLFGQIVAG